MNGRGLRPLAADRRLARHAGFWWGLAEGVAFFIVPDVYITFATLFSVGAGAVAWAGSIAGSLLAIVVIRGLMPRVDYLGFLGSVPGISDALIEETLAGIASAGLPYTPLLVLGGVPLKLYAAAAFTAGIPLGTILFWTGFARVVRIAPAFLLTAAIRRLLHRRIDARPGRWVLLLAAFWTVFYAFYFFRMTR